jgi:Protein of unknown function (DUF2971)
MAATLYKFVGPERVDVLDSCTIRFSPGSSFNDAFDVRPFFHELDSWAAASEAAFVLDHLPDSRNRRTTWLDPAALLDLYYVGGANYTPSAKAINRARKTIERLCPSLAPTSDRYDSQTRFNDLIIFCLRNGFGVLTLTEEPDNLLMWTHYAKDYTGFCIGFNRCHWFFSKSNDMYENHQGDKFQRDIPIIDRETYDIVQPVHYSTLRPQLDIFNSYYLNAFSVKAVDWKYEKEWRMIRSIWRCSNKQIMLMKDNDPRLTFYPTIYYSNEDYGKHYWPKDGICRFPPDALVEVVLGPLTSAETEARIRSALRALPCSVAVRKARLHGIDYAIRLSDE